MFMKCLPKVLNYLIQFVGITSTQRLRDNDFNSVLQATVRVGHIYLLSNVKRIALGSSSEKENSFVPETGIDMEPLKGLGGIFSLSIGVSRLLGRQRHGSSRRDWLVIEHEGWQIASMPRESTMRFGLLTVFRAETQT